MVSGGNPVTVGRLDPCNLSKTTGFENHLCQDYTSWHTPQQPGPGKQTNVNNINKSHDTSQAQITSDGKNDT